MDTKNHAGRLYAVYQVKWTEYERGWGQRPDGETYYPTKEAADKAIKDYWDSMPSGSAPECYSSPGTPTLVEATKELYDKVHNHKD